VLAGFTSALPPNFMLARKHSLITTAAVLTQATSAPSHIRLAFVIPRLPNIGPLSSRTTDQVNLSCIYSSQISHKATNYQGHLSRRTHGYVSEASRILGRRRSRGPGDKKGRASLFSHHCSAQGWGGSWGKQNSRSSSLRPLNTK
jgi:hypothetical protein